MRNKFGWLVIEKYREEKDVTEIRLVLVLI
jgi:hypothetical protein